MADTFQDLCPEVEEHEHNSGVKMAGEVYFPVTVSDSFYIISRSVYYLFQNLLDCDTYVSAAAAQTSRSSRPAAAAAAAQTSRSSLH